jgi:N-acetylmuramoyl-L-alanine amidase
VTDTPLGRASSHYVVDEDGRVYSLVPEEHRAWHAGVSGWQGEGDVNGRSIGIEIVNGGHDFGLPDFTQAQIEAVIALLKDIFARWPELGPGRVVAHSDVAPERKADPGEKFPWKQLADAGVSIWPEHVAMQASSDDVVSRLQLQLAAIGYDVKQSGVMDNATKAALVAFQRRFRPDDIGGAADDDTQMLVAAVARLVRRT